MKEVWVISEKSHLDKHNSGASGSETYEDNDLNFEDIFSQDSNGCEDDESECSECNDFVLERPIKQNSTDYGNYESNCWIFNNFEDAVKAIRLRIKEIATSENSLFDGKGHIRALDAYVTEQVFKYADADDQNASDWKKIFALLQKLFTDENAPFEKEILSDIVCEAYTTICSLTAEKEPELIINRQANYSHGSKPNIHINLFSMNDPNKRYFCHIEDSFESWDYLFTSRLLLDLQKVTIDE